jgi:biopolymer transport protein TolQ
VKEAWAVTSVNLGGHFHGNVLEMVLNAGPMVQFVLLLLLSFSIISWAIILMKYRVVRKSKKENRLFMDAYMKSGNFSDVFIESKKFRYSTIAEVFRAGYTELGKLAKSRTNPSQESETIDDGKLSFGIGGVDNIERALNRASDSETSKIESFLGFLATAGNSSPFIGLFGTVWGIMNAFRGIGTKASATLAVVAPGISEALIATAAGLAVAIPAVIFYNYYLNQVKGIKLETDDFALEFLNIVERYYIKK